MCFNIYVLINIIFGYYAYGDGIVKKKKPFLFNSTQLDITSRQF